MPDKRKGEKKMRFRVYDYIEYCESMGLLSEDGQESLWVNVKNAWNDDTEDFDEEAVRYIVEEEVSKRFPGSTVEW